MKKFLVTSSDTDSAFNGYVGGGPEVFDDVSKLTADIAEDMRENEILAESYSIYEIVGEFRYTPPTDTGTLTPVQEK